MMEDGIIEIKAYKCPFCGYYSTDKKEVIRHSNKCQSNPNYTQECLHCHNLESDFKQRIMFPDPERPYCCCFYDNGKCPYKNHTNRELMEFIEKEKERLSKYGIVENEQGEFIWRTESEDKE